MDGDKCYTFGHSKRRPQRVGIFECCIGNVTLRPTQGRQSSAQSADAGLPLVIYLLRINISAFGRNMISKSSI
jgi:hypothetical protein